jgi:hypothetical protein
MEAIESLSTLTIGSKMTDNQIIGAALLLFPLLVGLIYAHVAEGNYNKGFREGYHRGRAVNRQEFWQE